MTWPWINRKKAAEFYGEKITKLRNQRGKLREQRDLARKQRDAAGTERDAVRAALEKDLQYQAEVHTRQVTELQLSLNKALIEGHLYRVLHKNVLGDLEVAEANPLPKDLEWPLPPSDLRFRIGGLRSGWTFLTIGKTVAEDLQRLAREAGRELSEFQSVLDFGCGCGRVIRHLPSLFPDAQIHGADVDPGGVEWCRDHLGFLAGAHVLPLYPPSGLQDNAFDFIFAISVFTHLPYDTQMQWFAELRRIARPGAMLILTYMPESTAAENFTPDLQIENIEGFTYYKTTPLEGMPDYYHVSYHTEAAIRHLAGKHFKVHFVQDRAVNNHQSAVVCTVEGS